MTFFLAFDFSLLKIPLVVLLLLFIVWCVRLSFSPGASPKAKVIAGCIALAIAVVSGYGALDEGKTGNLAFSLVFSALYLGCCISYAGTAILKHVTPPDGKG